MDTFYINQLTPSPVKLNKQSSPETQSVSSLDFGNYGVWEPTESNKASDGIQAIPEIESEFVQKENITMAMISSTQPTIFSPADEEDKYSCFKAELNVVSAIKDK
jgi:hypothetical protein